MLLQNYHNLHYGFFRLTHRLLASIMHQRRLF